MKPKVKRHPEAVALDKWLETDRGKRAVEPDILSSATHRQYLENRIKSAFSAGWDAREQSGAEHGK